MALTFPTGHDGRGRFPAATHGTPERARPCQCKRPLIDSDSGHCRWCGKYPKATINETFAERSQAIQLRGRQRKLKAA